MTAMPRMSDAVDTLSSGSSCLAIGSSSFKLHAAKVDKVVQHKRRASALEVVQHMVKA